MKRSLPFQANSLLQFLFECSMQTRYNMSVARQKKPLLARLTDIRKACAAVF